MDSHKINKAGLLPVFLVFIGLLVRIFAARFEWLNMDEGCYLNDANMVLSGLTPLKDFVSREPLFIFLVSFFYGYLGRTLFAARLLSVFASGIIIWSLYGIGARLFDKKVGVLAATLYALSPYAVDWGILIKTEVISSMFVTLAVFTLAIYIKNDRRVFILICGLLLGVSMLVRRNSLVALLLPLIVLICKHRTSKKSIILGFSLVLLGFLTTAGFPLVYLVSVTDFNWIWNLYGLGELVHPPQLLMIRLTVFWSAFMMLFYMIIPCIIFVLNCLRVALSNEGNDSKLLYTFAALISCSLIVAISISGTFAMNFLNIYGYGIFYVSLETNLIFIVLTMLALSSSLSVCILTEPKNETSTADILAIGWLVPYVLFYAFYPSIFTDYFNDFTPSLSLLAALGLSNLGRAYVKNKHFNLKYVVRLFHIVSLSSGIIVALFVVGPYNCYNRSNACIYKVEPYNFWERSWDPAFVQIVADYVASITEENEEVFTADTAFVSLAQRRVVCNISYPHHYIDWGRKKPMSYDPYSLTYSIDEIIERMETKRVRLAVIGPRTLLMFQKHPELQRYIELRYVLAKIFRDPTCIDSVKIYVRASYSEERIEFFEDFSNVTRNWITIFGSWNYTNGTLSSAYGSPDWRFRALAIFNYSVPDNVMIEIDLKITGEGGIVLRYQNRSNYYLVRLICSPNFEGLQFLKVMNETEYEIASSPKEIIKDAWYRIKIVAIRSIFHVYVNSTLQFIVVDETFQEGVLALSSNYGSTFDNLFITNDYKKLLYP